MIEISRLGKDYEVDGSTTTALRDISLNIKSGEFVAIMGPSGSGKSTLLHILSLLDRPTSGSYSFSGKNIDNLSDTELAHIRNKKMGFVFQAFNLLGRATVYENIEMPLLYAKNIHKSERRAIVEKAAEAVSLEDKIKSEAGRLSGGQKQRVAIARALVNDPDIIFADEPTGNLDSKSGGQVMEILSSLHKSGRTVVLVTHETYTAEFANRLIKIKDGEIESDETIRSKHLKDGQFFK